MEPGLVSTSPAFVSNSASHPAGSHGRHAQKNGKSGPHCWGREGSTQFAQQLEFAVTGPPLVGCVIWSHQSLHALHFSCLCLLFHITLRYLNVSFSTHGVHNWLSAIIVGRAEVVGTICRSNIVYALTVQPHTDCIYFQ